MVGPLLTASPEPTDFESFLLFFFSNVRRAFAMRLALQQVNLTADEKSTARSAIKRGVEPGQIE